MSDYQLASGETILRSMRKHWINILPVFISSIMMGLVILVLVYAVGRYGGMLSQAIPVGLVGLIIMTLAVLAALIALVGWWVYTQNRLILTNQHLIEISQIGLFNRKVSQLSLAKVQDVSSSRKGLAATVLGFGDITIETAGEEDNFTFHQIANAPGLCQEILQAHEALVKNPANDAL